MEKILCSYLSHFIKSINWLDESNVVMEFDTAITAGNHIAVMLH